MRQAILIVAAVLILALPGRTATAWRDDGHRIVCHIAFMELEPGPRREVVRLIKIDPANQLFEEGCIWADAVKYTTHRETEPWHYMNLEPGDRTVDMGDCAPDRGCLLSAIALHIGVLEDAGADDEARLQALKYLGHWLGDLHQPLHFGSAINRGGNNSHVIWQAMPGPVSPALANPMETNLHKVWDDDILQAARMEPYRYAARLWMTIEDAERAKWQSTTVLDWAQESRVIALAPETGYDAAEPMTVREFGKDYASRHLPMVETRLKAAGVRLGALLNRLMAEDLGATDAAEPLSNN